MLAEYRLQLPLQTTDSAHPDARPLLEQAQATLGFVPNMYGGMANSPGLLATYLEGYNRFRQESGFTMAEQEVVFLTISRHNSCGYCLAAHSMIADAVSKVPPEVTAAIRQDRPIPDPRMAELNRFTRVILTSQGLPSSRDVQAFLAAGYSERHVLEIILAIAVKTLSNYSNHLFHTPVDPAFAGHEWVGQEEDTLQTA